MAKHVKVAIPKSATTAEVERLISEKILLRILDTITPEQNKELVENLNRIAKKHGQSFKIEGGILAALGTAQLSGFGIYLAASTVVGVLTSLLGITLPFAFYTAISSAISVFIGPLGWVALGIAVTYKAGAPDMKKLLPAVLFIAAERNT